MEILDDQGEKEEMDNLGSQRVETPHLLLQENNQALEEQQEGSGLPDDGAVGGIQRNNGQEDAANTEKKEEKTAEKAGGTGGWLWTKSTDGPGSIGPGADRSKGPPGPPHVQPGDQVSQTSKILTTMLTQPPFGEVTIQGDNADRGESNAETQTENEEEETERPGELNKEEGGDEQPRQSKGRKPPPAPTGEQPGAGGATGGERTIY